MTRFSVVLIVLLTIAAPISADRRRAVRGPRSECTFSLTPSYATPVPSDGIQRGPIAVQGSPSSCTSWDAFDDATWVTIEKAAGQVFVTVAPNPLEVSRSTVLTIAGLRHEIVQLAAPAPPLAPANLLTNGSFDTGTAAWTWFDRYPNGAGSDAWASLDAGDRATSGSYRLRSTQIGHSFQRLQCVAVDRDGIYEFGGSLRVASTTGGAAIAVFQYADSTCSGDFTIQNVQTIRLTTANTWSAKRFTFRVVDAKGVAFLVASAAITQTPFDVWFDDLFLRQVP